MSLTQDVKNSKVAHPTSPPIGTLQLIQDPIKQHQTYQFFFSTRNTMDVTDQRNAASLHDL
jgi:hypothetical protein